MAKLSVILKVPEAAVLQATLEYLALEKIHAIRLPAGRGRVGGRPIKLAAQVVAMAREFHHPLLNQWDGMVRINEQWLPLAEGGTLDVQITIPKNRKHWDPLEGEIVSYPIARAGFIETKAGKNKLSDDQAKFKRARETEGAVCYVVRSIDDIRRFVPPRFQQRLRGM